MSSLSSKVLTCCSPFLFAGCQNTDFQSEVIAFQGQTMNLVIPEKPLASGSMKLVPRSGVVPFSGWSNNNRIESYELIQKVIQIWKEKGINDYLIYGKESDDFSLEIVPYEKKGWRFWKQFKVLWKITFGGSSLPYIERLKIAKDFAKNKELFSAPSTEQIESVKSISAKNDAFCNPEVIKKQAVFEGKHVNVLYNYAPIAIGEGKLHFLIVPKKHHVTFSELTKEEYLESADLEQKLIKFYLGKGYHTAYLFNKTGAEAGQTVPHWHEHLVFTATKTQEFFGRLIVLKNMLFGSSPLSKSELQKRVELLKIELRETLK